MMATLADEIADVMNEWFDQIEKKDADSIVRRTSLQIGIHNYARFEYVRRINAGFQLALDIVGDPLQQQCSLFLMNIPAGELFPVQACGGPRIIP